MIDRAPSGDFSVPQVHVRDTAVTGALTDAAAAIGSTAVQQASSQFLRKKQADDAAALVNVENSYSQQLLALELEAQKSAPASGDGYLNSVKEQREKAAATVLGGMPRYASTEARAQAGLLIKRLDGESNRRATIWQDQRATAFAQEGFATSLNTAAGEVLRDPTLLESKKAAAMTRLSAISGRLTPDQEANLRLQADADLTFSAIKGYTDGNLFGEARKGLEGLSASLTPDQQRQLEAYIESGEKRHEQEVYEGFSLQVSDGAIDEKGLKKARDAGDIPDDGYYRALKEQLAQRRAGEELERKRAEAEAQDQNFAALRVGIDDGTRTRADADALYRRGMISHSQWAQAALAANDKATGQKYAEAFVSNLQLGIPIDPTDSDMKKGAEQVFQANGGKDLFLQDWDGAMRATASMAAAGVIPETPVTVLRGMKSSGTPPQQMAAIEAISDLYTDYPNAADAAFTAGEVAEAISFRHKLDAGIDPEQAYQAILKEREARNEPSGVASLNKQRIAEARKLSADFTRKDALKEVDKGGFLGVGIRYSGGTLAENQIVSDYQDVFQTYYVQHGDEDLAKKQAKAVMARTVGTSRANGGRVMMHPPERYYPDTGNKNWMRDSLATGVSELMGLDVKADEIELVSDQETSRAVRDGEKPTYAVQVKTGSAVDVLPYRWSFDEEAARQMADEKSLAESEKRRDRAAQNRLRRAERNVEWSTPQEDSIAWANMSEVERQVAREAHERAVKDLESARREAGQ